MAITVDELVEWMLKARRTFYHFTDTRNVGSISELGLLSMDQLRRRGLDPVTGGDATSLSIDAAKGYDKYVHLCFRGNHPMEFAARSSGRIEKTKFIKVSPQVLRIPGTVVSNMIVTSNDCTIGRPDEMINTLDLPVLYTWQDWKDPSVKQRLDIAEKYEILVPDQINVSYLSGI